MTKVHFLTKRQEEILESLKNATVKVVALNLNIKPSTIYSTLDYIRQKIKEGARVKRKYRNELYRRKKRRRY